MAVADVAVEMGPRNRRRAITAAIVVAAVAIVFWGGRSALVASKNHSNSGPVASRHLTLIPDNLTYGMTKQQMARRLGRPEKIAGNCWQYHEGVKDFVGQTVNAVRLCFTSSGYQVSYVELDGKWRYPNDTTKVIPPPTSVSY
ncbi:MAG TPA: hypothetical protein VFB25_03770 [Gaiellaceae bacterium]|nr:hypothetical protein [Gaiellaceae bacterium]